jgi:glycolate oxidase iron-sulfur subunit
VKHSIAVEELGPLGPKMAAPIESCVHCGFCLPTCPTYQVMGEEMDSPRGRIILIKEVLGGDLELEAALPFIDNCLGCEACVSACPSGVEYGDLLTAFRAHAEPRRSRTPSERARRAVVLGTLSRPRAMRGAARLGAVAQRVAGVLPPSLRAPLRLLPRRLPPAQRLPELVPAQGPRRARVALLAGCAQQVLAPEINAAAVRVLARNGVEVAIPRGQGCCGSLALHAGAAGQARGLARRNLESFPEDVDAVLTTAAGCGSGMAAYPTLFAGEPEEARSLELAARTVDVTAFLASLGLIAPPPLRDPVVVAYQDACHLAHAQGVREEPRSLLGAIDGVTLAEPAEAELCCGSAGIYNVEKPEVAAALGARKAKALRATGADVVASGNIGCITQLRLHLDQLGSPLPIMHTAQLLDLAYSSTLEETIRR